MKRRLLIAVIVIASVFGGVIFWKAFLESDPSHDIIPYATALIFTAVGYIFFGGLIDPLFSWIYRTLSYPFRQLYGGRDDPRTPKRETPYSFSLYAHNLGYVNIINPFRGIAVVGAAGSGKSKSIAVPIIRQVMEKEYAGFLYDFKYPELTGEVLSNKSGAVDIYNVNFTQLDESHRVNPLHPDYIENSSYADEFANTLIFNLMPGSAQKDDFWVRSARAILSAAIWYMRDEYPEYCTLPHVVSLLNRDEQTIVEVLSRNLQSRQMISSFQSAVKKKAHGQVAGMLSTAQTALNRINTPEVGWILSGHDFDLDLNDPDDPSFLNIGIRPEVVETYAPLISLIMTVALKQMNQPGKQHSIALIDEAPTLYIPNIERIPATARSHKVVTMLMCQDLSQMRDMYGKEKTQSILSNLNNQFFGRVSTHETAKYISDLFGKEDRWFESMSESEGESDQGGLFSPVTRSENVSRSWSVQQRKVVREQEPLQLEPGLFYTLLVEGDWSFGLARMEAPEEAGELPRPPKRNEITDEKLKENFHRIHEEVEDVIKDGRNGSEKSDMVREI